MFRRGPDSAALVDSVPPRCPPGDHAVEEGRRGEEEHVPAGRHRGPEVRGLGRIRERPGAGGQGGERLAPPPPPGGPGGGGGGPAPPPPRRNPRCLVG